MNKVISFYFVSILAFILILTGCANKQPDQQELVNQLDKKELKSKIDSIYTDFDLDNDSGLEKSVKKIDDIIYFIEQHNGYLSLQDSRYYNSLMKNRNKLYTYLNDDFNSEKKYDYEDLDFVKEVYIPFHSVVYDYKIIYDGDKTFMNKVNETKSDYFLTKSLFLKEEDFKKIGKNYLIGASPLDVLLDFSDTYDEKLYKDYFEIGVFHAVELLTEKIDFKNHSLEYNPFNDFVKEIFPEETIKAEQKE